MFWLTGSEEHTDPRFTTHTLGLYTRAGSWAMSQVHDKKCELPAEWLIPFWAVRGWGNTRQANELVAQGIWDQVPDGYVFDWIRPQNTPDWLRKKRKTETNRKAAQRSK